MAINSYAQVIAINFMRKYNKPISSKYCCQTLHLHGSGA